MQQKIGKFLELTLVILLIAGAIWFVDRFGIDRVRANVSQLGIWAPLILVLLRLTSIIVPVLPGTAYALLAGALLGFGQGLTVVLIADFLACNTNFFIARRYGRRAVQRLVGKNYICYALGLSRITWQRFVSALVVSLALVKPPVVAAGAGLIEGEKLLIGVSAIGMLAIAIISARLRRKGSSPSS
jgi:uncharacterized membrane protein YdjX (TVP38/TMEM64 family)